MKKSLVMLAALFAAASAFAQGQIVFNNIVSGVVRAPVYGVDPSNPTLQVRGNTASGTPAGTAVYGGAALAGTGYSMELFGGPSTVTDSSALVPCTVGGNAYIASFRTGTAAGFISPSGGAAVTVPGVAEGSTASLQLRAWDNASGTIPSFDAAAIRGSSSVFTSQALGGTLSSPPYLVGLTSFNLTAVPEPSTIALGVMGAAAFLARRRKQQ